MKKNLFLLFSIYFFVLQPLIIGILWNQANFFRLGAINLIAIISIGIAISAYDKSKEPQEANVEHERKSVPVKEARASFHDHFRAVVKERKKKSELIFPTIISLIIAIAIFFMLQYSSSAIEVMLLLAFVLGFIVFLSLTLMFKHRITKSFWALVGTKLYLVLLICSLALTAYDYYQVHQDFNASFEDYIAQNFLGQERIPTDGYVFTGEGSVLGSGLSNTAMVQDTATDIITGENTNIPIQEETGKVIAASTEESTPIETVSDVPVNKIGNQTLIDAVSYLLKKNNIPLISKHDISFTYVTFQNPLYDQWRTAYANRLIGKATNPTKYIVCESYIVMKGLLGKRNVPYTASTVLANFWAEAIKRDALNGCEKGKIVTDKTL
ncbi:MAG: hypothetical protein NTY80_02570 [candidate division SR1 bacterium]|nr:hypothetical protein [candidate division SR1 bacterium]